MKPELLPNGRELPVLGPQAQVSGRGTRPYSPFHTPNNPKPLAFVAESTIRFGELLSDKKQNRNSYNIKADIVLFPNII